MKMPFMKMIMSPIQNLFSNIKTFLYISVFCGLITSLISVVLGIDMSCLLNISIANNSCNVSELAIVIATLLKTLLFFFCIIWYAVSLDKQCWQNPKRIFLAGKKLLFAFGGLVLFLIINLCPLFSLGLMYIRVPNENWKIEVFVFAFFFILMLLPIVLLRFYSIFWDLISFNNPQSVKKVWQQTSGNGTKLLAVSFLWLIVSISILRYYHTVFSLQETSGFLKAFVFECGYSVVLFFGSAIFVNIAQVQKSILQGDNK